MLLQPRLQPKTSTFDKPLAKRVVGSPRDESVCGGVNGKSFFLSWQNFRVVLNPEELALGGKVIANKSCIELSLVVQC
jgi:hypothetical protein